MVSSDADNTICAGESVTFTGSGGDQYEFYVNGSSVQAQSADDTYDTTGLTNAQIVTVRVVNTTTGCDVLSGGIGTTVNALPTAGLSSSDADNTICAGESVTFTGSGGDQYEFYVNGSSVQAQSADDTYDTTGLTNAQIVTVRVVNTTTGCDVLSGGIGTTVNALPTAGLSSSDADNTICAGESVTFTGSGGDQYEFYVNGSSVQAQSADDTYDTTGLTNAQIVTVRVVNTTTGCDVLSGGIGTTVNALPAAPTGDAAQTFCSADSPLVSDLSATGTGIIWYTTPAGTTVASGALVDGTTYYASQTTGTCEGSDRLAVTATVTTTPGAPTGDAAQTFCSADSPLVSDLSATGTGIIWYTTPAGTTVASGALVDGTTYYASQTTGTCEGSDRLAVTATVTTTPGAPTGDAAQTFCSADSPLVSDLSATGTGIIWYTTPAGTTVASGALVDGTTYYASQTTGTCEGSDRLAVTATVTTTPGAPTGDAAQTFCSADSPLVSDLSATGTGIIWYTTPAGTTVASGALVDGTTYYASQTTGTCEGSDRLAVTATVTTTPGAPTGDAAQTFCSADSPLVSNLSATGTGIIWYTTPAGTTVASGALVDGTTYYASQTTGTCEGSDRLAVTATVTTTPGAPTGDAAQTFCSADSPLVSDLSATGTGIIWYTTPAGTTVASGALVDGTTYYASQTTGTCEGSDRLAVTATVTTTPGAPTGDAAQTFCSADSPLVSDLSATGTGIIWYTTPAGTTVASGALVDGTTYYASQTTGTCEGSDRLAVTATVTTTPGAPTGDAAQTFCSADSPLVSDLSATGTGIIWYTTPAGTTVASGALVDGTTYYASQTTGTCEGSDRLAVTATVTTTPGAPTGDAAQTFCSADSPLVSDLSATGTGIIWYTTPAGTTVASGALVDGTTYYASQTTGTCEGSDRLAVTATVTTTPGAPTGDAAQTFCSADSPLVSDLSATGTGIIWYTTPAGTTVASGALVDGTTYYASQTTGTCEGSDRLAVTATVTTTPGAPTGDAAQTFCSADSPLVSDLSATGTGIIWYTTPAGTTVASGALVDGTTYYASQTTGTCEGSDRLAVTATVTTTPGAPTGDAAQTFCSADSPLVSDLSATGTGIIWYTTPAGTTVASGALVDGTTYYASQTTGTCEGSDRLAVTATVTTTPGAPTGDAAQTFCSADSPLVSDLSATGTGIIWYTTPAGTTVASGALVDGTTYYASQTTGTCEGSDRLAVTATVTTTPGAPTGDAAQTFCSADSPLVSDLSATGTGIIWYTTPAGTTVASGALVDGTTYYASQTTGTCEGSDRLAVTATVTTTPGAPTGDAAQTFCSADSPLVSDLSATGTGIIWYTTPAGTTVASGALVDGTTYYASQTTGTCEGSDRLAVTATVTTTPGAPTGDAAQTFCSADSPLVSDLSATGTGIIWYTTPAGTTVASGALVDGTTYYASQTTGTCEGSDRLAVTATVTTTPGAPTGDAAQTFCSADSPLVSDLSATGTGIIWYTTPAGTTVASGALVDGTTYYASQTTGTCEGSDRLAVTATVTTTPGAPTGDAAQTFCSADSPLVSDLSATGTGIIWYTTPAGTTVASGALVDGTTYYASQTTGTCEGSDRLAVTATVTTTPGAPTGDAAQTFCSADSPLVSDLSATGTGIIWYTTPAGTTVASGALVDGTTYYASQTTGTCEGSDRLAVTATVTTTPGAPTGDAAQTFCSADSPLVSNLSATGTGIIWYTTPAGTTVASGALVDGTTYYASQTTGTCEGSDRLAVTATVTTTPGAATIASNSPVCSGDDAVFTITGTVGDVVTYTGAASGTTTILAGGTVDVTVSSVLANTTLNLTNVNNGNCDLALSVSTTVTVNALPTLAITSSTDPTTCSGTDGSIVLATTELADGSYTVAYAG